MIFLSLASVTVLFVLTKLIGNKQISQMTMLDYVIGISIGSIAAEMATEIDKNGFIAVIAMSVYAVVAAIISYVSNRSLKLRRLLNGRTVVLMRDGVLFRENMKKAGLDINELLSQLRLGGYFDLSEIDTVFFEPNGMVSVLPKSDCKPATAKAAGIKTQKVEVPKSVVIDGTLLKHNLKQCGYDEAWLFSQLKAAGYYSLKAVFLATCTSDGQVTVYSGCGEHPHGDMFL